MEQIKTTILFSGTVNDKNVNLKSELLLLLDLDGTIIFPGEEVDPELLDQLRIFNDSSSLLITTARHPKGVQFVFNNLIGFIPTISLNGGALHLSTWNKYDSLVYIERKVVDELTSIFGYYPNVICNYYTEESWYATKINAMVMNESRVTGITPKLYCESLDGQCVKILLMGSADDINNVKDMVTLKFGEKVSCYRSNEKYLEINSAATNKAFFVKDYLAKVRHVERNSVSILFVGDSENDIECAKYADYSWTYYSSPGELKKYCSILTEDNGNGLKSLLTKLRR